MQRSQISDFCTGNFREHAPARNLVKGKGATSALSSRLLPQVAALLATWAAEAAAASPSVGLAFEARPRRTTAASFTITTRIHEYWSSRTLEREWNDGVNAWEFWRGFSAMILCIPTGKYVLRYVANARYFSDNGRHPRRPVIS